MTMTTALAHEASVEDGGKCLRVVLPTGLVHMVEAATLWVHCPSALRRRQRHDERIPPLPSALRIARITPIGNYALNIAFSDGHDRGVYPWPLLEELAQKPKLADFLITAEAGMERHIVT